MLFTKEGRREPVEILPSFEKGRANLSMVVHGESEFGGGDDSRLGSLCLESHNPYIRMQLMPEDIDIDICESVEQRLADEAHVASSRAAPRVREEG